MRGERWRARDGGWAVQGEGWGADTVGRWRMRDGGRAAVWAMEDEGCGAGDAGPGMGERPPRLSPAPLCLAGQLYRRLAPEESGELRLQVPSMPCRGYRAIPTPARPLKPR